LTKETLSEMVSLIKYAVDTDVCISSSSAAAAAATTTTKVKSFGLFWP
jgi:hypothetical protein